MRAAVAAAVACLTLVSISSGKDAEAAIKESTNIPAQPLGDALQVLAHQRNFQIVYLSDSVDTLQTAGATGQLTTPEALTKLLDGTGLAYRHLDDKTITVYPVSANAGQAQAGSMASHTVGERAKNSTSIAADASSSGTEKEVPKSFWQRIRLAQAEARDTRASEAGSTDDSSDLKRLMLEEVMVTAQRREEKLQDVPISISVLDGAALDRSNLAVIAELERVPGLSSLDAALGGKLLTVRGVGATSANFAGTSTVGYYLESVPFGFIRQALAPDSSAYDLDRVEVLRGPQGTLYGVSAANGVVRVLTQDADPSAFAAKFRGLVSSTEDGAANYRGDAAVNLPVIQDRLAARFVVSYEDQSGWIERPTERELNDTQNLTLRMKVNAQPTDDLSLGLLAWQSESDFGGRNLARDDRTNGITIDEPASEDYNVYGLKIGYDFSAFALSSSTSYIDYSIDSIASLAPPGVIPIVSTFSSDVFSQEIALTSTAEGAWKWSAGGIYRDVADVVHQRLPGVFPNPNGLKYNDYSESFAIFGELTRRFLDGRAELTAGVRYFEDDAETVQRSNPNNAAALLIANKSKFDKTSPRVVLTWHASDNLTAYTSYSEGFRSGFSQTPTILANVPSFPSVGPDNLINYEMGAKGEALDGMLSFDAAVFYMEWKGVQQQITVQTPTIAVAGLINGESASGSGAEFGVALRPVPSLVLQANYSWNALEFDSDVTTLSGGNSVVLAPAGSRLTNSPEHTAGLSADYTFPLGAFEVNLAGSVNHVSERLLRAIVPGVPVNVSRTGVGDDTTTARASLAVASPDSWRVTLFVENLTDYNGSLSQGLDAARLVTGDPRLRPRTIGLQFDTKF